MFEAGCLELTQEQPEYFVRAHFISGIESIDEFTNLTAWVASINARPATQKGLNLPLFPIELKNFMRMRNMEEFAKFYMLSIDHDHAFNILFL
ncbi:unnamed protein product [Rhizophagus irregularis]|nr:unnamed protein product [Rhizophagus irregularis]